MVTRASLSERVERINAARGLLLEGFAMVEAAEQLASRFQVSPRQAYRYLEEAVEAREPLRSPEPKVAFTVKLPIRLVEELRSRARKPGRSLSDFVAEALWRALGRGEERGGQ
jgi:predicted DNA-binding transcriptional regulator YafY